MVGAVGGGVLDELVYSVGSLLPRGKGSVERGGLSVEREEVVV